MASQSVDSAVLKRTKETLGKLIKRPALTDKLLSRPPFRYLHDIITEVIRCTSFLKGLYSAQEMDAKTIQDRETKVAFLQKAIDALSFTTGEVVRVKPSKIVAGQEAEKTNEFLQILAITIMKKLDSSEAVERVLKGEKPSEALAKEKKRKERGARGGDNGDRRKHSGEKRGSGGEEKDKRKSSGGASGKSQDGKKEQALASKSQQSLKSSSGHSDTLERPKHRPSHRRPPPEEGGDAVPNHVGEGEGGEGSGSKTLLDRPSSAKGHRRRPQPHKQEEEKDVTITAGATAEEPHDVATMATRSPSPPPGPAGMVPDGRRPSTARPAPPKIIRQSTVAEDLNPRIPSGSVASGPAVILDRPGDEEEEEEEEEEDEGGFAVEDSTPRPTPTVNGLLAGLEAGDEKPEGALTKTIMATKERLEGELPHTEGPGFLGISEAQRKKERELVAREIERLQSSIQTLCRSANPLGKIMDYVQEDMDSMQKELEMWKTENEKHTEALRREQSVTELELFPLRAQLEELEARAKEQVDLISATKANILKNDERIQQMLHSLSFSTS